MKELKLKLDQGHSVTDIEEHLTYLVQQIPTAWSNVLKVLKIWNTLIHITTKCVHHMIILFFSRSREEHPTCIRGKQWQDCIDYY